MNRSFRLAGPALCIILLLQVVMAPLHCLAMARAGGFEAVLCSAEGIRVIQIDADGHAVPAADGDGGLCVVCAGIARAVPADPPALAVPLALSERTAWFAAASFALPPPARGPPYIPTGPPLNA